MGAQGTTTVDFGAFPGKTDASATVIGQATIAAGSLVEAFLWPVATADHSVDEHYMAAAMLDVIAGEVVAGVGFTIRIVVRELGIGGEPRQSAGEGRTLIRSATLLQNQTQGEFFTSKGGTETNRHYGAYTVAWVWN